MSSDDLLAGWDSWQLNPYEFGQPVDGDSFINRRKEIREIVGALGFQRSGVFFLRGDYRIGKSSILRSLGSLFDSAHQGKELRNRFGKLMYPVQMTCEAIAGSSRSLEGLLLDRIQKDLQEQAAGSDLEDLGAALSATARAELHPVIMVDEVGLLPHVTDATDFISRLPSFLSEHEVHFVFSGPFELQELPWSLSSTGGRTAGSETEDPTGPTERLLRMALDKLENVTRVISLTPFSTAAAVELIRLSEKIEGTEKSLRGFEEAILELGGLLPYTIQVTCHMLYNLLYVGDEDGGIDLEDRRRYLEENPRELSTDGPGQVRIQDDPYPLPERIYRKLESEAYEQLTGFFDQLWQDLLDREQRKLLAESLKGGRSKQDIEVASPLHSLVSRGYLREQGNSLWLFSSLFEKYIRANHAHRPSVPPPSLTLRPLEGKFDHLVEERGLMPPGLIEYAGNVIGEIEASEEIRSEDLAGLEVRFNRFLAQVLAYLSQIAIAAYLRQPHLHRPELNALLRQRRFSRASHGIRLEFLRRVIRIEQIHDSDPLHQLRNSLLKSRSGGDRPKSIAAFVTDIRGLDRSPRRVTLMDFLAAAVRLRNELVHPETRAQVRTDDDKQEVLRLAWLGVRETLTLLEDETGFASVAQVSEVAEDPELSIALKGHFGTSAEVERGSAGTLRGHSPIHPGLLYLVRLGGSHRGPTEQVELLESSLFPMIVSGGLLAELASGDQQPVNENDIYMLIHADEDSMLYIGVGDPEGTSSPPVKLERSDLHVYEPDPLASYDKLFEQI